MRTIVKNTVCCLLFFTILIGLLQVASLVVEPKNNSKEGGIHDYTANGILSEPDNTIDAVILGDSETYSAFIPLKIWQEYGITSYVCGTSRQRLYNTEDFLHKTFQNQSPKLVILETNVIFRKFGYSNIVINEAENLLPVFRYHDRWKKLQPDDWFGSVEYTDIVDNKGYRLNKGIKPASIEKYMEPSDIEQSIPGKNCSFVKRMKEYCDKNGAEMILLTTPSTRNWNFKRHNGMAKLAEKLGVEYIDLNLMNDKVPINWEKDTRDKGDHLNYAGALKVTGYLGEYLAERGLFSDKREDPAYENWNKALKRFETDLSKASSNNAVNKNS